MVLGRVGIQHLIATPETFQYTILTIINEILRRKQSFPKSKRHFREDFLGNVFDFWL